MKFSVILPVRNGGQYVKECVNSILAQTNTDFNIIILDNGSTDGTTEWIRSLQHSKINHFLTDENLSIEENWSRIKAVKKNQFMTMIGHDDLLHPYYLEIMDKLITAYPTATLYQTHFRYIDDKGDFVRDCIPMPVQLTASDFLSLQMQRKIDSTGTGYMMRSEDFDQSGGMPPEYPNLIFADFQLWISIMLKGYLAISEQQCFSYRLHQSLSRTTNGMGYQRAFSLYIQYLTKVAGNNQEIRKSIDQYGKEFLLYYCESLSHRLLKTPVTDRSVGVADFIKTCESLAKEFIPDQSFKPSRVFRIQLAKLLDRSAVTRKLFQHYKKV